MQWPEVSPHRQGAEVPSAYLYLDKLTETPCMVDLPTTWRAQVPSDEIEADKLLLEADFQTSDDKYCRDLILGKKAFLSVSNDSSCLRTHTITMVGQEVLSKSLHDVQVATPQASSESGSDHAPKGIAMHRSQLPVLSFCGDCQSQMVSWYILQCYHPWSL